MPNSKILRAKLARGCVDKILKKKFEIICRNAYAVLIDTHIFPYTLRQYSQNMSDELA